jgi:MFS transporter, DHA1 family, inner membrane transport protein
MKLEKIFVAILASIQFSHIVDFVVLMPLGPILMREFNITPIQFGTLVSSYNFSAAITGLFFGLIADRYGRKTMLIITFIGFILGTFMCALATTFESLLVARIIAGAFGGTLTSVVYAMVTDLIPYNRRGKAVSTLMSSFSIASIVGVPLGLWIAEKFSWRETFYFIVLISTLSLVASVVVFPKLNDHIHKADIRGIFVRLYSILTEKAYAKSYLLIFLNVFAMFSIIPYLSPYAVKNMGILETDLKYMYLISGLVTVITARFIGKYTDHHNPFIVFSVIGFLSIVPIYLYTHSDAVSFMIYICISVLFMSLVSGRMIPIMTLISEVARPNERGTYMGLLNAIRSFASGMATLYAGLLIFEKDNQLVGFDTIGNSSIIITILIIPFCYHVYIMMKKIKDEREANGKSN